MVLLVLLGALVAYQIWVSILVVRSPLYEARQKWLQFLGIWLAPLIGAVVAHSMMRVEGAPPYKPEPGWTEPGENDSRASGAEIPGALPSNITLEAGRDA